MYVAVDIGGTNTRVVGSAKLDPIAFAGEPIRRRNSMSYEEDIAFIVDTARQISDDHVDAIGIGLVGELSDNKMVSIHSKNNGHWNGKPFAHDIGAKLKCRVFADNDAVAAALGEAYYGQTTADFAYVIWGTGIGGALVMQHDAQGSPRAKMLDWHTYFADWEQACGGKELQQLYGKSPEEFSNSEWHAVLKQFTEYVQKFADATTVKAIVFGGGLSARHKQELEALSVRLSVRCRVSGFDGDSGLYGGFALIRNEMAA